MNNNFSKKFDNEYSSYKDTAETSTYKDSPIFNAKVLQRKKIQCANMNLMKEVLNNSFVKSSSFFVDDFLYENHEFWNDVKIINSSIRKKFDCENSDLDGHYFVFPDDDQKRISVCYIKPRDEFIGTYGVRNNEERVSDNKLKLIGFFNTNFCEISSFLFKAKCIELENGEQRDHNQDSENILYGLKLVKGQDHLKLMHPDKKTIIALASHLKNYSVLKDFDKYFNLQEKIGEGKFGKVYKCIRH